MSSIDSTQSDTDASSNPLAGIVSPTYLVAALLAVVTAVSLVAITSLGGGDVSAGFAVPLEDSAGTLLLGLFCPVVFFCVLLVAESMDA